MAYKIFRCPSCGGYLGKARIIKPGQDWLLEVVFKCREYGRCKLAKHAEKRGEAIFDLFPEVSVKK